MASSSITIDTVTATTPPSNHSSSHPPAASKPIQTAETNEKLCLRSPEALPDLGLSSGDVVFLEYPPIGRPDASMHPHTPRSPYFRDSSVDIMPEGYTISRSPTSPTAESEQNWERFYPQIAPPRHSTVRRVESAARQAAGRAPGQVEGGAPGQVEGGAPGQVGGTTPGQVAEEAPGQAGGRTPGPDPGEGEPTVEEELKLEGRFRVRQLQELYQQSIWKCDEPCWAKPEEGVFNIAYIRQLDRDLLKAVVLDPQSGHELNKGLVSPQDANHLITDLRLRSFNENHLTLFLGMPYLGVSSSNDGLELYKYHGRDEIPARQNAEMRVWQAWHVVFDDSRLALFKSPASPSASRAPLFPFQQRLGIFHTLSQLLGNLFLHESAPFSTFKKTVQIEQHALPPHAIPPKDPPPQTDPNSNFLTCFNFFRDRYEKFDERIKDVFAILAVTSDQLQILLDFWQIIDSHQSSAKCHATYNALSLPFLMSQKEQIKATLKVLDVLIAERKEKIAELKEWLVELRETRAEWLVDLREMRKEELAMEREKRGEGFVQDQDVRNAIPGNNPSLKAAQEMNAHLAKQGETAENMESLLEQQGQTVTVFTLTTTIFLPLSFFAGYLGMNTGVWSGVNSHREFWRITGPITVALMLLMSYFMFVSDDYIKSFFTKLFPCLSKPALGAGTGAGTATGTGP